MRGFRTGTLCGLSGFLAVLTENPVAMVDVPAGSSLDALIGPSRGGLHGRFAIGGCPPGVDAKVSLGLLWRTLRPLLGNWLGGRSLPSPFVAADGVLVSPARVITREARAALYGG